MPGPQGGSKISASVSHAVPGRRVYEVQEFGAAVAKRRLHAGKQFCPEFGYPVALMSVAIRIANGQTQGVGGVGHVHDRHGVFVATEGNFFALKRRDPSNHLLRPPPPLGHRSRCDVVGTRLRRSHRLFCPIKLRIQGIVPSIAAVHVCFGCPPSKQCPLPLIAIVVTTARSRSKS